MSNRSESSSQPDSSGFSGNDNRFPVAENRLKSNRDFVSCSDDTHRATVSHSVVALCNETRAPASTGMKRRIARGVSIFLVYIMYAQVNRNTRNYKASRVVCTSIGFRIYSYGAQSFFERFSHRFSVADRAISGERRSFDACFFIATFPLSSSRVDTSPANSRHRDASH